MSWRTLPEERRTLYSPVGLQPVDDASGQAPIGPLRAFLDARQGGAWRPTSLRPVVTQSGIYAYPGLGRRGMPAGQPPRRYRVRFEAAHYIADYRPFHGGIEFDADAYDDANPPATTPYPPLPVILMPGPTYPFASHLLVLRGQVVDSGGAAVPAAEVSINGNQRSLTDARGCFALGLPRPQAATTIVIDALDAVQPRTGAATVAYPEATPPQFSQGPDGNIRIVIS